MYLCFGTPFTTMIIFFFRNDDVPRHSHGTHRWESLLSARMTVFEHEISFHCLFLSQTLVYSYKDCLTQIQVLKMLEYTKLTCHYVIQLKTISKTLQLLLRLLLHIQSWIISVESSKRFAKIFRVFSFDKKKAKTSIFSRLVHFDPVLFWESKALWCCFAVCCNFINDSHTSSIVKLP